MKAALENKEFFVMYQPKIDLTTDKIVGAEALVRWNNPKFGMMAPNDFIPLFERNGFIKKLDFYVYDKVFDFIQRQIDAGQKVVPISVNMSRNHSKPEKFMHDFMTIFNKYSFPPSLIQVEIIERSFMDNNTLKDITDLLHKEGFTVAMDDFGSGESSLNMITRIPVDVLKFDRSFLLSFTSSNGALTKESESVLELLIDLSKTLNKETVFEGVETKEQRDFLKSIDCDQAQGFFYSRPLSEPDFMRYLCHK
jgi:EAL domain-containing protein (putative c-di-GMP-specific phosphodiesterase class I)